MAGTDDKAMTSPAFCKNGCGFYGSPNTEGLCSKCFRDLKKEDVSATGAGIPAGSTCRSENKAQMASGLPASLSQVGGVPSIDVSKPATDGDSLVQPTRIDIDDCLSTDSASIITSSSFTHRSGEASPAVSTNATTAASETMASSNCFASLDANMASAVSGTVNITGATNSTTTATHSSTTSINSPNNFHAPETSTIPPIALTGTSGATTSPDPTTDVELTSSDTVRPKKSRCNVCNKKLGLTGFNCRCGGLFCSIHRYADGHECDYDYKTEAKNAIRKANPKVDGEKIAKI